PCVCHLLVCPLLCVSFAYPFILLLYLFFFFFYYYGDHRDLHSFPTRRSSDLTAASEPAARPTIMIRRCRLATIMWPSTCGCASRSEEHTSELQSRVDLVCRLLLEKKKKIKWIQKTKRRLNRCTLHRRKTYDKR